MQFSYFKTTLLFITLFVVCSYSYGQTIRVISNKGTIHEIETGIGNVAQLYDAAGGQVINEGTYSLINFGAVNIVDTPDYTHTANSITIVNDGRYEIMYTASTETNNNQRNGGEFYLEIDGSEAAGTRAYTYSRNNLVDKNTVTVSKIVDVVAPSTIRLRGTVYASNQTGTSSQLTMVANGSSLLVKRIK